jgi:hypothetical protein
MLEAIDQVVLATDRIVEDSAGIVALQHWLRGGGRLWIMADRMQTESVAQVLGDAMCYEPVDRVELTEFTLVDRSRDNAADRWSAEYSVELVRVLSDAAEVHCEIDGWPAALWQRFGDGEVLITTLSSWGWMHPRVPFVSSRPLNGFTSLAGRFYKPKVKIELPAQEVYTILQEQIGYEIPSSRLAGGLLLFNCVSLAVAGTILIRRRQLEQLAWIVPLVTLATTGILLGMGVSNSQRVPPTLAALELVRTNAQSLEASVSGIAALYSAEPATLELKSDERTFVVPRNDPSLAETKRLVWNDGRFDWLNYRIEPGSVRFLDYTATRLLPTHMTVRGQFGPQGLEGQLQAADLDSLEDVLIAHPPALGLAVQLDADGSFRSGSRDVLAREQYLADTVLSDQQRRRQQIYRHLLSPTDEHVFPGQPTLFAWSTSRGPQLSLPEQFAARASSLFTVPLYLERTPPATAFQVPATFIRIESFRGASGTSTVYNPRTGRWMEDAMRASRSNLRFQLPAQVLPCQLNRATVTLKLNAPSRTVRILQAVGSDERVLREYNSPSGVLNFTLEPEVLALDDNGGLHLTIDVSSTELQRQYEQRPPNPADAEEDPGLTPVDNSTWQVDYVRLDAEGTTL